MMKQRDAGSRESFPLNVPVALCLFLAVSGCSRQESKVPEVIRPVKSILVLEGGETGSRAFPGIIEASKQVELAFQVTGLLVSLPVREGQKVVKDQVIAQLRPDEFRARLESLQGQLDRARANLQASRAGVRPEEKLRLEAKVRSVGAQLANAQAEFNRSAQLLRSRTISHLEHDRAETSLRVAQENYNAALRTLEQGTVGREEEIQANEAEVRSLEGRVVEASIQLDDTTLRAPYDGVIAQRFVEQGQNVSARQPVIKFQDVQEISIALDIPEAVMSADLRSADIVKLDASFRAAPGVLFPVHITEIAQRADPVTQTFRVRAAMQSPKGFHLLPGMTATVTITYRRALVLGQRIVVPITALFQESPLSQVVWVIGSDGSVSRRPVKTGAVTGGGVEILEGIAPGERVAVAGVSFLRDGMKVRDLGNGLSTGQP